MTEWLVEIVFALSSDWKERDVIAKNIADTSGAEFFGSGAGFNFRDISWILSNKKKANSLRTKLKRAGFNATVSKAGQRYNG